MTSFNLACPGCGARFDSVDDATHGYMTSSPACWNAFNEILAREFQDPAYFSVHQLSVDAYAVQHPGDPADRCAVQSVNLHLTSLYVILELKRDFAAARYALKTLAMNFKNEFRPLSPPAAYDMTVKDVLKATSAGEHCACVRDWATAVWNARSDHHDVARAWVGRLDM